MNLPVAKYKVGDNVYMVRGLSFIGLTIQRIVYIVGEDGTEIQYEGINVSNQKKQPTREDELVADLEEAKVLLHKENQIQYDVLAKQISEAINPFTVKKEENVSKETQN